MQTTTTLFTKERAEYLAAQNTSTDGDWIYKAVPVTGSSASHCNDHHKPASNQSANCHSGWLQGAWIIIIIIDSSNTGTTSKLTNGTAKRLANGEISAVLLKNTNNNGVRPMAIQI